MAMTLVAGEVCLSTDEFLKLKTMHKRTVKEEPQHVGVSVRTKDRIYSVECRRMNVWGRSKWETNRLFLMMEKLLEKPMAAKNYR